MNTRILLLAAALALPVLAAAETHTVRIEGMQFVPATLTVKAGDKVLWRNADLVPHTVTAAGQFDSRTIVTEGTWSYVPGKAGSYPYACTLHPGMKGTLVVR